MLLKLCRNPSASLGIGLVYTNTWHVGIMLRLSSLSGNVIEFHTFQALSLRSSQTCLRNGSRSRPGRYRSSFRSVHSVPISGAADVYLVSCHKHGHALDVTTLLLYVARCTCNWMHPLLVYSYYLGSNQEGFSNAWDATFAGGASCGSSC